MRHLKQVHSRFLSPFRVCLSDDPEGSEERALLLSQIRLGAIAAALLAIAPAMYWDYLLPDKVFAYILTIFALGLFNLFARTWTTARGTFAQLSVDLLAQGTLLVLTAGCHNPLSAMIFVSGIMGPIFLKGRWASLFLLEAALTLTTVCLFTEPVLLNANGHEVSAWLTVFVKVLVLFTLGGLTMWLKTCLDAAQKRYLQLYRQKQRLNNFRALGVVTGQLSHELSTPLNTMRILLDRIARSRGADDREIIMSRAALDQCSEIVKRLFETNVDAGCLDYKELDVAESDASICEKWRLDFPSVRFQVEVEEPARGLACRVPASPSTQAVLDILDNAVEASAPQQAEIHVAIAKQGGSLAISISDRGMGISHDIKRRVGEPFISTKELGTGLGLYNAKALFEALGGTLAIDARAGGGTTVAMVLPL